MKSPVILFLVAILSVLGVTRSVTQDVIAYAIAAVDPVTEAPLIDVTDTYPADVSAEVLVSIITSSDQSDNVQASTYNWRSCLITNSGDKRIAAVFIDITNALFPDIVFDKDGSGGDDVAKPLEHNWGTTETKPIAIGKYDWTWLPARGIGYNPDVAFDASALGDVENLFVNELSDSGLGAYGGDRGILVLFEEFDNGETYEFSVDLDPNSIAGLQQGTASIHAEWDVGGVSGAELIGSSVTVLFGDGTTAAGTIASDGSQATGVAVVRSSPMATPPSLNVDGTMSSGGIESYSLFCGGSLAILVSANVGDRVRVTMVKGFDPVDNQKELANGQITAEALVSARLNAQFPFFPVNNAKELQHVEVVIGSTGTEDVSSSFDIDGIDSIAFTAVVIDDGSDRLPLSDVASPVYLIPRKEPGSCQEVEEECNIPIPIVGALLCLMFSMLSFLF